MRAASSSPRHGGYAPFTMRAIAALRSIPRGKVATYGQVAAVAGHPGAARQIARILHTLSDIESLPWHRVVGGNGTISLPPKAGRLPPSMAPPPSCLPAQGFEVQKKLLELEGVRVGAGGEIDMKTRAWSPRFEEPPESEE